MEIQEFNSLLTRLYDGEPLSNEELTALDNAANQLLDDMAAGPLEYERQNALDLYVQFFDDSRYLDPGKTNNVMRYYQIIEDRKLKTLEQEKASKPAVLTKKPINNDGIISAIAVIEVVVVLGMLIAFIAFALLQK